MPRVRKCRDNALPKKCRKESKYISAKSLDVSGELRRKNLMHQELSLDYRKPRMMSSPTERPECSYLSRQT